MARPSNDTLFVKDQLVRQLNNYDACRTDRWLSNIHKHYLWFLGVQASESQTSDAIKKWIKDMPEELKRSA